MAAGAPSMPRILTVSEEEILATLAQLRYLPARVQLDVTWPLLEVLAKLGGMASEMASTALAVAELVARLEPEARAAYDQAFSLLALENAHGAAAGGAPVGNGGEERPGG